MRRLRAVPLTIVLACAIGEAWAEPAGDPADPAPAGDPAADPASSPDPGAPESDSARSDTAKSDAPAPDAPTPDRAKADTAKVDVAKPDAAKPDRAKAEAALPPDLAFARAPRDPAARLAFAESLVSTPGYTEEAVEALALLLREPSVAARARAVLAPLLAREGPRRGWSAIYADVLADPALPEASVLDLRLAQLQALDPRTRRDGIRRLRARFAATPHDRDVCNALGDALMHALDSDGALDVYRRAGDPDRTALAALAAGKTPVARVAHAAAVKAGGPPHPWLDRALADATPRAELRARALIEGGFPELAQLALELHTLDPAGALLLGSMYERDGEWAEAAGFYTTALGKDPDNVDAKAGRARVLLAQGHIERASSLLPASDPAFRAARLEVEARATTDRSDDGVADEQAYALNPADPEVAFRVGQARFAAGHVAEAYEPLGVSLEAHPANAALLYPYVSAALAAGHPDAAIEAAHRAIREASTPALRRACAEALASALAGTKPADHPEVARRNILAALALRPDTAWIERVAGGMLWSQHETEAARRLYLASLRTEPGNVDARVAAATLAFWAGDRGDVDELLAGVPGDRPDVRELRAQMAHAKLVDEAKDLAQVTDPVEAERRIRKLLERAPGDAELTLRLADVVARQGRHDEALALIRQAEALAPGDPWPVIAESNELLATGDLDGARERLDSLPADLPKDAARERDRARARILRVSADAERDAGRVGAAVRRYAESVRLDPDPWTLVGLAALYAQNGEGDAALAVYDQIATAARTSEPTVRTQLLDTVDRGRAGVLEAMGRRQQALGILDGLVQRSPTEANTTLRDDLKLRSRIADADDARRAGELDQARAILADLQVDHGEDPNVHAALAAIEMDAGHAKAAVEEAARALTRDPHNEWALDTAARAGPACGCTKRVIPYLQVAAIDGVASAKLLLQRARMYAALEKAADEHRHHRRLDARAALHEAADIAGEDGESLRHVGEAARDLGFPQLARRELERAFKANPKDGLAAVDLARMDVATLRLHRAEKLLAPVFADTHDPDVGMELARLRARLAKAHATVATLDAVEASPVGEPSAQRTEEVATIRDRMHTLEQSGGSPAGFGVLARSGIPGLQREFAMFLPVHAEIALLPWRLDIEAVPLRVTDGIHEDEGIAPSIALSSAADLPLSVLGRIGTSPIGFDAGFYPTWDLALRVHPVPTVLLSLESGRVPLQDSLASWAGQRDALTGEMYGSVSAIWAGATVSWGSLGGTDLGAHGSIGWTEGLSMERNGRRDAVVWFGHRFGEPAKSVRIGVEGVGSSNDRQLDGFSAGNGAYYSPPLFGVGLARVDGRWHGGRFGICASVAGGVQHSTGLDSPYFASGTLATHTGRLALGMDIMRGLRADLEGTWLAAGDEWHQETGMFRLSAGNVTRAPSEASPLTTFSLAGGGLVYTGDPC